MTIRVLRLYRGDHGNDLPMIYLHTDNRGRNLCNGDPVSIVSLARDPCPVGMEVRGCSTWSYRMSRA
jgi:hypothetical protein